MHRPSIPTTLAAILLPLAASAASPAADKRQEESPSACTSASFSPSFAWTVESFDYHASYLFTTPAHQNSWGYASFNLSNPAFPDQKPVSCEASSNQLSDFFYGTVEYTCDSDGSDISSTSFRYSYPSGELDLRQVWGCDDGGMSFNATGSVTLDLDCKDETWQNPDWQMGETYSDRTITCKFVTVPVEFGEMTVTRN